jgi:biopolymer transport protein ExbD
MNRILAVCFVGLTLTTSSGQKAPPLQSGISVEMPATNNGTPAPEADRQDAVIVTVTGDGNVYLGVDPIDLKALAGELAARFSGRSGKKLYIKGDGRAPYAMVVQVLDAASAIGIERTVLLTARRDSLQLGTWAPPQGFAIVTNEREATTRPRRPL